MPTASSTPSPASSKGSGGSASSPPTAQPAQARDAAEGQAQEKTKQQTKKENLKSAAAKKALPHLTEEERAFYSQCNICDEWLPLTEFPPGGGCVCARDDLARESLQRMLRNRWKKEYTKNDPLKIKLDAGVHKIVGEQWGQMNPEMNVTCSHITFVGKAKDHTTIHGGFYVRNRQNVKFEGLTVMNSRGSGFNLLGSETNVDVLKCAVKECGGTGMFVKGGPLDFNVGQPAP